MNAYKLNWKQNILVFLFFSSIAISLLAPLASNVYISGSGYDMPIHVGTIVQAGRALAEGQFPLRVDPHAHVGRLYPYSNFILLCLTL